MSLLGSPGRRQSRVAAASTAAACRDAANRRSRARRRRRPKARSPARVCGIPVVSNEKRGGRRTWSRHNSEERSRSCAASFSCRSVFVRLDERAGLDADVGHRVVEALGARRHDVGGVPGEQQRTRGASARGRDRARGRGPGVGRAASRAAVGIDRQARGEVVPDAHTPRGEAVLSVCVDQLRSERRDFSQDTQPGVRVPVRVHPAGRRGRSRPGTRGGRCRGGLAGPSQPTTDSQDGSSW